MLNTVFANYYCIIMGGGKKGDKVTKKRGTTSDEQSGPSKKIRSPHVYKIPKGRYEELKLDEKLVSILGPCKEQLMSVQMTPDLLNNFMAWAEDVKNKLIEKEAQTVANELVDANQWTFTESKIATPKVTVVRTVKGNEENQKILYNESTVFFCDDCHVYKGYPCDLTEHYFNKHYNGQGYICTLCKPESKFTSITSLRNHLAKEHSSTTKEERTNQVHGHPHFKEMNNFLSSVSKAVQNVWTQFNPPKTKPSRPTEHSKIQDEERKIFMDLFDEQNDWRLENIFDKPMPLLSIDKDVTIFKTFMDYEDRQTAGFPTQFVYMWPSYKMENDEPKIYYTVGCGTVIFLPTGNAGGWNSALRKSIKMSLKRCASSARANDKMSIVPQFAIIIYWNENGTDSEGNIKATNISSKMDCRNLMTEDLETFFVALYSKGNIDPEAKEKIAKAISVGAEKIKVKVTEYLSAVAKPQ